MGASSHWSTTCATKAANVAEEALGTIWLVTCPVRSSSAPKIVARWFTPAAGMARGNPRRCQRAAK